MDILIHALSGVAAGTVIASIGKHSLNEKIGLLSISAFGGILPDFDAISLWSKFDLTIGKWFGLAHRGKEIYSEKYWYSHHGFMHSMLACLLLGILMEIIFHLLYPHFKQHAIKGFIKSVESHKLFLIAFSCGFCIHLLEDIPTPGGPWGGIDLFWPGKTYIGGTGNIWWWNNYDIFLIVLAIITINTVVLFLKQSFVAKPIRLTLSIFIIGASLIIIQIKNRDFNFNNTGHTSQYASYELKSKEIQKRILGDKLYNLMISFDNKLKINF